MLRKSKGFTLVVEQKGERSWRVLIESMERVQIGLAEEQTKVLALIAAEGELLRLARAAHNMRRSA